MRLCTLLCLPILASGGCTWWSSQEYVLVTSDPLGARILVDGIDTGRTTPARLQIGGNFGRDHVIELTLAGYRPERRTVYQYTEGYTSKWIDGAYETTMPPLPLFWTDGDLVFPFAIRGALVPDLFVKMHRTDAPKLGFELLAEREPAAPGGAQ